MLAQAGIHLATAGKSGSPGTTVDAGLRQHDEPV
jgi:hypothetical protein